MAQESVNKKTVQISIPETVYLEIEAISKEYNETPNEMAAHLLNAQIDKARHKDLFYPGLKWCMPQESVIKARIHPRDVARLQSWIFSKDVIELSSDSKNALYILNRSAQTSEAKATEKTQ